jgi:preprotein translocase subunit SecA
LKSARGSLNGACGFRREAAGGLLSLQIADGREIMIGAQLFSVLFRAQTERNFRRRFKRRAYLLEFDDVLSEEEEFIREQKKLILHDRSLKARLKNAAAELTADMIETFDDSQWYDLAFSFEALRANLRDTLGYRLNLDMDSEELFHTELLQKRIVQDLERTIEERERIIGQDNLNGFIRDLYLHLLDAGWEDYHARMKKVRGALYLCEDEEGAAPEEYRMDESGMITQTRKEAVRLFFLTPIDVFWKYDECFRIL